MCPVPTLHINRDVRAMINKVHFVESFLCALRNIDRKKKIIHTDVIVDGIFYV